MADLTPHPFVQKTLFPITDSYITTENYIRTFKNKRKDIKAYFSQPGRPRHVDHLRILEGINTFLTIQCDWLEKLQVFKRSLVEWIIKLGFESSKPVDEQNELFVYTCMKSIRDLHHKFSVAHIDYGKKTIDALKAIEPRNH